MKSKKLILLFITMINVSEAANFLEKLFKNHINDARCFSRCRSVVPDDERVRCINFCQMLIKNPEDDICALTSICTGGCREACADNDHYGKTPTTFASWSLTNCRLSWSLETTSTNVVFLVSGKDKAGKWNLIRNMVEDNTLELDTITVAKMEVIQIFAVEPQRIADVVSFDVNNRICQKPEPILKQGRYSKDRKRKFI